MASTKRRKKARHTPPFTMVYATWPRLLHEAGVSGVEWAVLVALARHPQRNGLLSRPVADYGAAQEGIATATGCSPDQVCRALSNLCEKRFVTLEDGRTVPVLTRKVKAHRGKVAVYKCNLPQEFQSDEGDEQKSMADKPSNSEEKHGSSDSTCMADKPYHLEKTWGVGSQSQPTPQWLR